MGGFWGKQGGVVVVNERTRANAGVEKLPSDTHGKWVKVERIFSPSGKSDDTYTVAVKAESFTGTMSVADIKLEAEDELALAKTERLAILAAQHEFRVLPFSPVLARIPRHTPMVEFRTFGNLPAGIEEADCEVLL